LWAFFLHFYNCFSMTSRLSFLSFGKPSTLLWPTLSALVLSIAWLLPNHYFPWTAFHADTWAAVWAMGAGLWVLSLSKQPHEWTSVPLVMVALSCVPLLQWYAGMIATSGQALVSMGYVLACGLSFVVGRNAQISKPDLLIRCIFSAVAVACITSVWLQLIQWTGQYDDDQFSFLNVLIARPSIPRPYANISQPNQLATLLVWGVIVGIWATVTKAIRLQVLAIYGVFLMLGIALTQSRIGMLEMCVLSFASYYWRALWPDRRIAFAVSALTIAMFGIYFVLPHLSEILSIPFESRDLAGMMQNADRTIAYRVFIDAALKAPLWGYGLTHVFSAQMAAADSQAHIQSYFSSAHNLILDLVLWVGIPLGLAITFGLFGWFFKAFKQIRNAKEACLVAFLGVFGMHAMVELPYHYASFLIPVSILGGCLSFMQPHSRVISLPRSVFGTILVYSGILLGLIASDYLRAEESFRNLRLENARIGKPIEKDAPRLLVLNQLEYMIDLQRVIPTPGLSPERLEWMRQAALGDPAPTTHFTYIASLALNGQPSEAKLWMHKLNAVTSPAVHTEISRTWANLQRKYPELAVPNWDFGSIGSLNRKN
jgi:hypothetical protein